MFFKIPETHKSQVLVQDFDGLSVPDYFSELGLSGYLLKELWDSEAPSRTPLYQSVVWEPDATADPLTDYNRQLIQNQDLTPPDKRPTHLTINLDQLSHNLALIKQKVGRRKIMILLKANAYGHGLIPTAQHFAQQQVDYFGVALLEEGLQLRQAAIETPILVLGGITPRQIPLFIHHNLTLTASSIEKLHAIEQTAVALQKRATVHLKIDTGMERIGIHYYSAEELLKATLTLTMVDVEGIFSHFANSDSTDLSYAHQQLERFHNVLKFYPDHNLPFPIRHIANSGAILQLPESYLDMVRSGILTYGLYPSPETPQTIPIKPALTWKSEVVYFKVVQPHHPISYGSTWQSDKMTRVVTIPVGYGDGYFRAMSGQAQVLIGGKKYPVVGRICMDLIMVNIGEASAYNGDEVILLGNQQQESLTAEQLADWANTIPYEIYTNINGRVPRYYLTPNQS